jgi:hypothetical protein
MAIAATISGLRPRRSDIALDATSDKASAAVDTDSTMLLCAALSANSWDNNGIRGCTQYSSAKQEKPPKNMARLLRLNSALPAAMRGAGAYGAGETGREDAEAVLEAMDVFRCKTRWAYLRIALYDCPIYI